MSLYIPKMSDTPGVTIPGLASNFQTLDGSQIVEWGSNENGTYWRWENGLQITALTCVINGLSRYFSARYDVLYGDAYYPAEFIEVYAIISNPRWKANYGNFRHLRVPIVIRETGRVTIRYTTPDEFPENIEFDQYVAVIGRWK